MSSTWSVNKVVLAHKGKDGQPRYALFEQTVSSNVYPRTYSWFCGAYGTIEQVMPYVFSGARCVEGGNITGNYGRSITPQGYISGWMQALAKPFAMGTAVTVSVQSYLASWNATNSAASVILKRHGLVELADKLGRGGSLNFDLIEHQDALEALFMLKGERDNLFFRRSLPEPMGSEVACPELAYNPAPYRGALPTMPKVMQIKPVNSMHEASYFMEIQGGRWKSYNARYAVVQDYLKALGKLALEYPKAHGRMIKAFREAVDTCPQADVPSMTLCVAKSAASWVRESIDGIGDSWRVESDKASMMVRHEGEFCADRFLEQNWRHSCFTHETSYWI